MAALNFQLVGLDKVKKAIEKKGEAVGKKLDMEMTASANTINAEHVARTPVDTGTLKGGNHVDTTQYLNKTLTNRLEYSPYVEFGTGGLVTVPKDLTDYAIQFKGAGVRKVNMRAQPFFFPPFFREAKKLIERAKKLIDE